MIFLTKSEKKMIKMVFLTAKDNVAIAETKKGAGTKPVIGNQKKQDACTHMLWLPQILANLKKKAETVSN